MIESLNERQAKVSKILSIPESDWSFRASIIGSSFPNVNMKTNE